MYTRIFFIVSLLFVSSSWAMEKDVLSIDIEKINAPLEHQITFVKKSFSSDIEYYSTSLSDDISMSASCYRDEIRCSMTVSKKNKFAQVSTWINLHKKYFAILKQKFEAQNSSNNSQLINP